MTKSNDQLPGTVLEFWFEEITPQQWFKKDESFDRMIADRFACLHARAAACELWTWRQTAAGRLAEIIVLDQFSRNMYRDSSLAFAYDPLALALAQEAVAKGSDLELTTDQLPFLYMPYMHSESAQIHNEAVRLFAKPGLEMNLKYERQHQEIITRFGRYPHRNEALGRKSTPDEIAFLKTPGSSF